jgi:hypothetical protein
MHNEHEWTRHYYLEGLTLSRKARANRPARHDATELALLAIMAALYPNGLQGWEDWNAYAAAGEWQ